MINIFCLLNIAADMFYMFALVIFYVQLLFFNKTLYMPGQIYTLVSVIIFVRLPVGVSMTSFLVVSSPAIRAWIF